MLKDDIVCGGRFHGKCERGLNCINCGERHRSMYNRCKSFYTIEN